MYAMCLAQYWRYVCYRANCEGRSYTGVSNDGPFHGFGCVERSVSWALLVGTGAQTNRGMAV